LSLLAGDQHVASSLAGLFSFFKQAVTDKQQKTAYTKFSQMQDYNYFIETSHIADATQIAQKLADIGILGGSGNKFPGPHTSFAGGSNPTGIILTPANIETMMGVDKDTRMTQESIESALASLFSLAKPSPNLSAAGPGHSGP
nr:hypothetical protein [Gammaproteobacteria bacterium]